MELLKISLIISLVGIFLLLALANFSTPSLISIGKINNKLINEKVQIKGTVFNIRTYPDSNFQVISIRDKTGGIDITVDSIIDLENNQEMTVIGSVKEYKEYLQVQSDKIITNP